MKNAELRFESGVQDGLRDVVAVRLRVYLDGEPSSAVHAAISGLDLLRAGLSSPSVESRPDALLRCAAPHVQNALEDGRLPLADRLGVLEIRVRADDLSRELTADDDSFSVDLNQRSTLPLREQFETRVR